MTPAPQSQPRTRRKRLAADGLPTELFDDVKRAAHRWLMQSPKAGFEGQQYRTERRQIDSWMKSKGITNPFDADQLDGP